MATRAAKQRAMLNDAIADLRPVAADLDGGIVRQRPSRTARQQQRHQRRAGKRDDEIGMIRAGSRRARPATGAAARRRCAMPKPRLNCCAMLAMLVAVDICGCLDVGIAHRLGRGELQRLEETRRPAAAGRSATSGVPRPKNAHMAMVAALMTPLTRMTWRKPKRRDDRAAPRSSSTSSRPRSQT